MKNKVGIFLFTLLTMLCTFVLPVAADTPTDVIENYVITVEPNEDATLNIRYRIDWRVLESESLGPMTWVKIGIPNRHADEVVGLTDNIESIRQDGNYVEIHFTESYYADERCSFEFSIRQDHMYQVDRFEAGATVYEFTPGWFDEMYVDRMEIRWNSEKATEFTPACLIDDPYYCWETALAPGEKFTVTVTYPNDAFAFDLSKQNEEKSETDSVIVTILAIIIMIVIIAVPVMIPVLLTFLLRRGMNATPAKEYKRVKITYYDACPSCGGSRKEGGEVCAYCGKNMVKSKEEIDEKTVKSEDKDILKYRTEGLHPYGNSPNVFVHVIPQRIVRPKTHYTGTSSSGRGSRGSSGCVRSSCACACACACAGGGRAGCTNKDFYRTGLKLKSLSLRKK